MTTCKLAKMPRLISSYRHLGKPKETTIRSLRFNDKIVKTIQ